MKYRKVLLVVGVVLLVLCALFLLTAIFSDPKGIIYALLGLSPFIIAGIALVFAGKRASQQIKPQTTPPELIGERAGKTGDVYITNEQGAITNRADGKPISDDEVPYLVEQGLQFALEKHEPPRRSSREDELSFQFFYKHGAESQKWSDAFLDHARVALKANDINERIRLLEETIALFYKARDWHYKTKGGMIYFQDVWEHCHNSKNPDFCWIENEESFLRESIFERDKIEPWVLQHAVEGFMQPEIYKAFPSVSQGALRQTIDRLVKLGHIEKNKEGRSYKITITK